MAEKTEKVFVSVIMPAYNEDKRIEACFNKVAEVLKDYGKPFEVILEEDGSTDKTPEIIDSLAGKYSYVRVLHFRRKMGKGFGIRKCFEIAKGEYIVLIDSDMEYPPEKIPELLEKMNGNDIVVGSRSIWKNRKNGNVKVVRVHLSRTYSMLIRRLFGISLKDYQSGFKAFRYEVIKTIQPLTSNGFEIDSEILIKALERGYKIGFIPIAYSYKGNSKVNIFSDSIRMLLSLLRWNFNSAKGSSCEKKRKTIVPSCATPAYIPGISSEKTFGVAANSQKT
jgi:glycosyltransferase involved in cell wall biosynthesis